MNRWIRRNGWMLTALFCTIFLAAVTTFVVIVAFAEEEGKEVGLFHRLSPKECVVQAQAHWPEFAWEHGCLNAYGGELVE